MIFNEEIRASSLFLKASADGEITSFNPSMNDLMTTGITSVSAWSSLLKGTVCSFGQNCCMMIHACIKLAKF